MEQSMRHCFDLSRRLFAKYQNSWGLYFHDMQAEAPPFQPASWVRPCMDMSLHKSRVDKPPNGSAANWLIWTGHWQDWLLSHRLMFLQPRNPAWCILTSHMTGRPKTWKSDTKISIQYDDDKKVTHQDHNCCQPIEHSPLDPNRRRPQAIPFRSSCTACLTIPYISSGKSFRAWAGQHTCVYSANNSHVLC